MTKEEFRNYNEKVYHVECNFPDISKSWGRWSGYRKGMQALNAIRNLRKDIPHIRWRIRIVKPITK